MRELGGERLTPFLDLAIADAKEQCQLSGVRLERRLVVGRQSRRGLDNEATVGGQLDMDPARFQCEPCADPLEGQPAATQRSLSAQTLSASASSRASALGLAMAQSER